MHPNVPPMVQRALPFSIDNILKPTFGGRGDEESNSMANHLFSPFLGASLASSILQHHHHQQSLIAAHAAAVSAAAATSSKSKENSLSSHIHLGTAALSGPFQPSVFSHRASGGLVSPSGSSLSSPRSPNYATSAIPPLSSGSSNTTHPSKPKGFKIKQEPPPPARSPEKGTLPKEAVVKKSNNANINQPVDLSKTSAGDQNDNECKGKEDEDVPPGMVRGPNGQLWPAWVFCTRYSDRPSSGK